MRKILSIIIFILIILVAGCLENSPSPTEPVPDPVIGTWNQESSTSSFIFGNVNQAQWAPYELIVKSDGTYECPYVDSGSWKWVSNNTYEFDSNSIFNNIPNGTAQLNNSKLVLSRSQCFGAVSVEGIYHK